MRLWIALILCLAVCGGTLALASSAAAQSGPIVIKELYHDTIASASALAKAAPPVTAPQHPLERPMPLRRIIPGSNSSAQPDAAEQALVLPGVSATIGANFEGIPNTANGSLAGVPSDGNLSAGATQIVETINTVYQVYDKTTRAALLSPAPQISVLFNGMPGLCGQGQTFFFTDPVVLYDKIAGRWLISIVASDPTFSTGNECIAVSATSDATGGFHRYAFAFGSNNFNDYPKFGVWPDAYYASYNLFGSSSAAALACALDRSAMLAGNAATSVCFTDPNEFSFLPSDLDGANLPPAGEPNFYVDLATTNSLHLFRFHVDFATPANSTFDGPFVISVNSYQQACLRSFGICIPQLGTTQTLDSLSDRLMFRLAYRNFGTHESLVANHAVRTSLAPAGVRWYEIRDPNGSPEAFQQGTITDGNLSLWMASAAMDKAGDIAVGFSQSSRAVHPAIGFTGRVPADPLNAMESPQLILQGTGSQVGVNRWGDYTSLSVDPSDDCTFWYVDQYMRDDSAFNFRTRIASFKFPSCQ